MKLGKITDVDQTVKIYVKLSWRELFKIGLTVAVVQIALHKPVKKETYDRVVNKAEDLSGKVVDKVVDKFGENDDSAS